MQKQKIRGMVLAAVVCCVSLSGCGAAEKTAQQTDLPDIIIGSDNYPPYNYENVDGNTTGIDGDIRRCLPISTGRKRRSWLTAEKSTASGAAFLLMGARRNTVGARLI